MLESSSVVEKKFNEETHRLIGEDQTQKFGAFLAKFQQNVNATKKKFTNIYNVRSKTIIFNETPDEEATYLQLAYTDNKLLGRILAGLGTICDEIHLLVREANDYYKKYIFYGEDCGKTLENIQTLSKFFETLQETHAYNKRVQDVVKCLIQQLSAILSKGYYIPGSFPCFPEVLNSLSELLVCLLTLDTLLDTQVLKEHWFLYRRTIRSILHNCSKYDLQLEEVADLDSQLSVIENDLFGSMIYKGTLDKCAAEIVITKNSNLHTEFTSFLYSLLNELERDEENVFYTQSLLQLNVLMVFTFHIFDSGDKKMFKKVLELNKKAAACTLYGNLLWYPEQFLLKYVPSLVKLIDEKSIESQRLTLVSNRSQNLPRESQILCYQACYWMIEIQRLTKKNIHTFSVKTLQEISDLLTEGLKLVKKISSLIKWIMNLHADKGLPVTKSVLLSLCKLIESLKSIYLMFNNNSALLFYIILLISQHLSHKALGLLHTMRKYYSQEKQQQKQHYSDILIALNLCHRILKGPNTNKRLILANLALSASGVATDNISEIRSVVSRLHVISNFSYILKKSCDCSFLYWHQMYILPVYFSKLINTKADLSKYYLILNALTDCALLAGDKITGLTDVALKQNLIGPINQIVETNLRLQTHLHLHLSPSDPIQNYFPLNFYKFYPAPMDKKYKSIKNETEHYLSMMFYNLTTVVLHDWKTYGEMRRLAYLQYGLETVDDNLPMQTLEQGLDVLEIMRNINVFVNKYLYNLNSQVFIEDSSNNKHLNSINISHVANSIRTHGIGIMNTTVNFTYQFLSKQFYIFSQFMFDEHIKSRLLKDLRYISDHKTELNQMYPYERADKFNFGIRKLGLNKSGQSYLDLFRKVITHIGNAMGYIRLIRSGGRRCLADGTCFIPDLKDIDTLNSLVKEENLLGYSKNAADCLLLDLNNFVENFEEATEYFKLLVKVFVPVFRNKNNIHLKNFYIIVPPLTINFIEHALTCKERLNKKNKADCAFTDDGFALGLAYIIELLDQESQLNSLHWFHSVQRKFKLDRLKIVQQKSKGNNDDDKLKQTLALTEKRINTFEREFQLLYYSFTSARLFFQS